MAKANRKAIEQGNFWDVQWIHGAVAGTPEIDANETKLKHQKKKDRLRVERLIHNIYSKYSSYQRGAIAVQRTKRKQPTKIQKTHDQIQYGFDIATWWNEQHV